MMATMLGRSTVTAAGSGASAPARICSTRSGLLSGGSSTFKNSVLRRKTARHPPVR